MTIKATYQALQAVAASVLPTFTFYGMYKDQYNTVKSIADGVIIVEPPRQWPINHRNTCEAYFDCKVWIGIRQSIKPATGGTFEYQPFNEIDIRDTLHTAALTYVQAINAYSTLRVLGDFNGTEDLMTLMDAAEGGSTNWQAWGYFTIKVVSYGSTGSYVPAVFAPGLTCVTQYTMTNGATLATGLQPDILYIDTGTVTGDYSSTGLAIDVPAGYIFRKLFLLSSVALSNFVLKNKSDVIETSIGAVGVATITSADKFPVGESLFYEYEEGDKTLYCEGNTSPGFRAILKFERSKL